LIGDVKQNVDEIYRMKGPGEEQEFSDFEKDFEQ
jgi:hypothetical protein